MVGIQPIVFVAFLALEHVLATPAQAPFDLQSSKPKKLHGRFLHITDIHPDPHYAPHTSEATACHRKKAKKKKKNDAQYYGTPFSDCDTPFRLSNFTLNFLRDNWAHEIDFVIWTGDNARHDNDRQLPRTPSEIYMLNRAVASSMNKIFHSKGIPVIPSLGNNDVWQYPDTRYAHQIAGGPNSITNEYASIWNNFIPFPYLQVFQRGAYYASEVVPNELAVISLNTMYFYDSNKVVSGCSYKERNDPGNLQIDWLTVQLEMFRDRGMQVWLSGHVPPSPGNYFPECYVRYVELALRFQDTILGHLFGHMNADHFFFLEADDLRIVPEHEIEHDGTLLQSLLKDFEALPRSPKGKDFDDYAVVNVGPSVVPNPYLPSFRIFSYNITDGDKVSQNKKGKRKHGHRRGNEGNKTHHCKSEEWADTWRCHLDNPWYSDPSSPSRSNQKYTPLGYAQYYIPELANANKTTKPEFVLEYVTYTLDALHPNTTEEEVFYPVPRAMLPSDLQEAGIARSKYTPYGMADLTVQSWMRLGRALGNTGHKKLRRKFRKLMFMGGGE